jgi:hypothetical protein
MTEVIRHLVFSPSGYRLLEDAIAAARLPKKEKLCVYADYIADQDRRALELEEGDVVVQRRPIDVKSMLTWLDDQRLKPDKRGRNRYLRAFFGENPIKRRWRRGMQAAWSDRSQSRLDMLVVWPNGPDSHWVGKPEASDPNDDWLARVEADRRKAVAEEWAEAELDNPGGRRPFWQVRGA